MLYARVRVCLSSLFMKEEAETGGEASGRGDAKISILRVLDKSAARRGRAGEGG